MSRPSSELRRAETSSAARSCAQVVRDETLRLPQSEAISSRTRRSLRGELAQARCHRKGVSASAQRPIELPDVVEQQVRRVVR